MSNPQCRRNRGGDSGRACAFYPDCACGNEDALGSRTSNQRDLLRVLLEDAELVRYEHGGARLAVLKDGERELIADFYGDGEWREFFMDLVKRAARATAEPPAALSELQSLASHLGGGGIDCTDAAELGKRIRWAIDHHIRATLERAASLVEPTEVTTLFDKDFETKRDARESGVRRRLAAEIRSQMPEGRAPEPPGDGCAKCSNVAPIANIRVGEDDTCEVVHLYAPGLPPGEHDLYPAASTPDREQTITSLCDRIERIFCIAIDQKLTHVERIKQIQEWSAGFMQPPSETKEARRDPPGSYRDATGELVIPSKRAGHIYSPMEGTEVCGICRFHKSEHAPEHMPAGETGDGR